MTFKFWLENSNNKATELRQIWSDTFKALGIGGLSDEDAAQQSLSRINYNQRGIGNNSTFKGKNAALKRLENDQIFARLQKIGDPDISKGVDQVKTWLGTESSDQPNASTTVAVLLQKLFGQKNFESLINSKTPQIAVKPEMQPQPPKPSSEPTGVPPQDAGLPPQPGMMGDQPGMQGSLPPKPAGAELGLF